MALNDLAILVAPTLMTGILAALGLSIRFLFQIKASQARIEHNQKYQESVVLKNTTDIGHLKERTAGLEGAVFKRAVIVVDEA